MTRIERIGDAVLYLDDCREVVPTLESIDLVLADPPYADVRYRAGMNKNNDHMLIRLTHTGTRC